MKTFDTELKKYSDKIALKVAERRELRERILSYMEYHPLKKQESVAELIAESIPSESFITLHFNSFHARMAGVFVLVLIVVAPFAAERSVPGDALYLVKTGFNETIQSSLANSPYEKIEFETKLMERRISEARVLASEGKLTEDVKTQIAETVKGHTETVKGELAQLRSQDAEGAAIAEIAFSSSLEVQSAVLTVNESTNSTSSIDSILTVVNEAHEEVVANQDTTQPSFEGLMARVELETTRVYELFNSIKPSATEEEIVDIERRLSDINRLVTEAKDLNTTDTHVAGNDLATTLSFIQKLIAFMTDIDVRETVELEALVPVVLSDIERIDIAKEEIRVVGDMVKEVRARLELLNGEEDVEKVVEALSRVDELMLTASVALDVADIGASEGALKEARALVEDMLKITDYLKVEEQPIEESNTEEGQEGGATDSENGTTTPPVSIEEPVEG